MYLNTYIYSKTTNKEEALNLKERGEVYRDGFGRKKKEGKCNSITTSKINKKEKMVYNLILNFEFLFYCDSWLFSVLRTALYGG